ncbi:MAG: iron-containing alcohol dehydrogenase [Eubacteriaceae bacterium]
MKKILYPLQNIPYRSSHLVMKAATKVLKLPIPPVLEGFGMVKRFPELIKLTGVTRVLIVTDSQLLEMGLLDGFLEALKSVCIEGIIYDRVQPNPTFQNVEEGLDCYLKENCNGVVAFGGGSPIDCGKMIAAKVTNHKTIEKMRGLFKLTRKLPPFFVVPTTSGTGSEATICAVITNPKKHEKFAINDPKLVPLATVLDPELTLGLPPSLTATTGMDALTHAIEAYIGKYDTAFVKEKALSATQSIINHLEDCTINGENQELRLILAKASFDAGLAFTRAYVGYVHAFAHAMGGYYGVPHGLANAIILPYILEFSKIPAQKKLAQLGFFSNLGEAMDSEETLANLFIDKIKSMNAQMNIPLVIKELKAKDIPFLAKRILKEGNPTYPVPRIMHYDECVAILEALCPKS